MTVKDVKGFLTTYHEENLKFVKVNYITNITQQMLWIVYWDVPSLKKF